MHIEINNRLANAIMDIDESLVDHDIETSLAWSELVWVAISKVYEYRPETVDKPK